MFMLRNALLETDGTPEVMTIIQVFTQLFVQVLQNENKQVGQDLLLNVSFTVRTYIILQENNNSADRNSD